MRTYVDLKVVFDRLGETQWSTEQLITYLTKMAPKLKAAEVAFLKTTSFLPSIDGAFCSPPQLHAPWVEELKHLECPSIKILKCDGLTARSPEGRFVQTLGIRTLPDVCVLLGEAAKQSASDAQRDKIISFIVSHASDKISGQKYFWPKHAASLRTQWLPATTRGARILSRPHECFSHPDAALLGLPVLEEKWRECAWQLGVEPRPTPDHAVAFLRDLPESEKAQHLGTQEKADEVFSYISSMLPSFTSRDLYQLSKLSIVPVFSKAGVRFNKPSNVFFAPGNDRKPRYPQLFDYVRFSPPTCALLKAAGVRESPILRS